MKKSYRNTIEIAKYAEKIGNIQGIEYLERHGKEVEEKKFVSLENALDTVLELQKTGGHGFETAAVLTMTEEEANIELQRIQEEKMSNQEAFGIMPNEE